MNNNFLKHFLDEFLNSSYENFTPILQIDFPVLFSVEKDKKTIIFYIVHFKKIKKQLACLTFSLENKKDILPLLAGEESIHDFFFSKNNSLMNYVVFDEERMTEYLCDLPSSLNMLSKSEINDYVLSHNISSFADLLPPNDFFLDHSILNQVDTSLLYKKEKEFLSLDDNFKLFIRRFEQEQSCKIDFFKTLLYINETIFFTFKTDKTIFFGYCIENEFDEQLILVSELHSMHSLLSCLNGEISVWDLIDKHTFEEHFLYHSKYVDFSFSTFDLGSRVDSYQPLEKFHGDDLFFEDLFPSEELFLDRNTLNKISMDACISDLELFSE